MRWDYLSIPKLPWFHHGSLGMNRSFCPTFQYEYNHICMLRFKLIHVKLRKKGALILTLETTLSSLKTHKGIYIWLHPKMEITSNFDRNISLFIIMYCKKISYCYLSSVGPWKKVGVPFHSHGLTLIPWISNHMPSRVLVQINHPFPYFNSYPVNFDNEKLFNPALYNGCDYLSMLGLKVNPCY